MQDPLFSAPQFSDPSEKFSGNGICLVVPACNDATMIGSLVITARSLVSGIIVVDDGSDDSTGLIANGAGARVLRHSKSTGYEESVLEGIRVAHDQGFAAVVVVNADGRFRAGDIQRLCEPITGDQADMVIGSRYMDGEKDLPLRQKITWNNLLSQITGKDIPRVTDPGSGFFALNRKLAISIDAMEHSGDLPEDLLLHVLSHGFTVKEVPVPENRNNRPRWEWIHSVPVLVAIPAFNEERTIGTIVSAAQEYCDAVLVLDDGSEDATARIASRMNAIVISHPQNRGYGASLKSIFLAANSYNAQALVVMDADGQHNPRDIETVLAPVLDGADIVIGSRVLKEGNAIPLYRKTGMKVLDAFTNYAGNLAVTDSQSGFRAYSRRAIRSILITEPGMGAGSEILVQAKDQGLSIVEIPVGVRYGKEGGHSSNPFSHGIRVLESVIWHITQKRPLFFISLPGVILCIIGLYFGTILLNLYNLDRYFSLPLSVLVAIFLILGALGMFMGITFHVIARILPRYERLITRVVREESSARK